MTGNKTTIKIKNNTVSTGINRAGFTLIELSIVLIIIGIILGLSAGGAGLLFKQAKEKETKAAVDNAVQAVVSFAGSNKRLPVFGNPTTGEFAKILTNPRDSWGQPFNYYYDSNLSSVATGDICGRRTTSLVVKKCPDPLDLLCTAPTATINNIAFVILSGGSNFHNQTPRVLSVMPPTVRVFDSGLQNIPVVDGSGVGNMEYDDIVSWMTIDELRTKAGCQGAPLKILNNELPPGSASSVYPNVLIVPDGGVPFVAPDSYRWCVQTTVLNTAPASLNFQKPDASGAPVNITSVANLFQTNCSTYAVASWPQAGKLILNGTPTPSTSYSFSVFVSDNNGNATSKPFVLTINP